MPYRREASFHVLVDGENVIPLASAQDHKPVGEGDTGPNTGGMGTYSPAPILNKDLTQEIMQKFIVPTVDGMKKKGIYIGGIICRSDDHQGWSQANRV